ncbi:MAG: FHA domain-containing protein [Bryobacteraceae bacterium]
MSFLSEVEKGIERAFRSWTERMFGPGQADSLIVSHHQVLEEVAAKVQTLARGRRVFPYNEIAVRLPAAAPEVAARIEDDVRQVLTGCEMPANLRVVVEPGPFAVTFGKREPEPPPEARVVVVRGKAELSEYPLEKARTNIGRLRELTDARERVVRRNDIVFEEGGDEANATVSRGHAHIRREGREYRLCDDGSQYGTRIFREGRPVDVAPANRRGERLQAGDEIYLGRACLRFLM